MRAPAENLLFRPQNVLSRFPLQSPAVSSRLDNCPPAQDICEPILPSPAPAPTPLVSLPFSLPYAPTINAYYGHMLPARLHNAVLSSFLDTFTNRFPLPYLLCYDDNSFYHLQPFIRTCVYKLRPPARTIIVNINGIVTGYGLDTS